METTCQASYPLNSENESPFGTFTVYLSCAEMGLPPAKASAPVIIGIVSILLPFITSTSFMKFSILTSSFTSFLCPGSLLRSRGTVAVQCEHRAEGRAGDLFDGNQAVVALQAISRVRIGPRQRSAPDSIWETPYRLLFPSPKIRRSWRDSSGLFRRSWRS